MADISNVDLASCHFSSWYNLFKNITIPSKIVTLSSEVVDYLKKSGPLILPESLQLASYTSYESDSDEDNKWNEPQHPSTIKDESDECQNDASWIELKEEVYTIIQHFGGTVFPKLGWSSPKDAVWINSNSLKCSSLAEVILLLKASEFVSYDLTAASKLNQNTASNATNYHNLILRKWMNVVPGMEFRCFIKDKFLIAITQRHHTHYYDYLVAQKDSLPEHISSFVNNNITNKFPLPDFVVDLYRKKNGEFLIIDFNPFKPVTDSLLFSWDELISGKLECCDNSVDFICNNTSTPGQFRYVSSDIPMQTSDLLSFRMPKDFIDLSTGNDATKLVDFLRMKTQNDSDSSSDEDEPWKLPQL